MPPRIPRVAIGLNRVSAHPKYLQICPICSISRTTKAESTRKRTGIPQLHQPTSSRRQSNEATTSSTKYEASLSPVKARQQLRDALNDLQKIAGSYVNISRLQLALRGLDQTAGQETIRIAVMGLRDGGASLRRAKQLLRAVIGDPLKEEEEWERVLLDETTIGQTLLLRIGAQGGNQPQQNRLVPELQIPWPKMNGNSLEILVLETDPPAHMPVNGQNSFDSTVLVPTMEIPTSNTGRHTPVTTPVHRALVIGEGIIGAGSLVAMPGNRDIVKPVVNLRLAGPESKSELPLQVVDVEKATDAIQAFRLDVGKAIYFEQCWFESGMADVTKWIESGTSVTDGEMKQPIRNLIESLIRNTESAMSAEEQSRLTAALLAKVTSSDLEALRSGLTQWGEMAHTELRDQLDIAFKGQRWRKLGWWKLFFRVDDVSSIASDILTQRFLTGAEKDAIFLSGRFKQAGIFRDNPLQFGEHYAHKYIQDPLPSGPPPPTIQGMIEIPNDEPPSKSEAKDWPLDIPATRTILSTETVPALQALAQKLVLQTLTTSTFTSVFAALIYVSTLSTSLYEAGAVASLGIAWSLRRMQGKWEAARKFWEGEVREEGRKAVRSTETALGAVLLQKDKPLDGAEELELARKAVEKAKAALNACK